RFVNKQLAQPPALVEQAYQHSFSARRSNSPSLHGTESTIESDLSAVETEEDEWDPLPRVPIDASHSAHAIPYEQEGNVLHYTRAALTERLTNRQNPHLVNQIRRIWKLFKHVQHVVAVEKGTKIKRKKREFITVFDYVHFLLLVYELLQGKRTLTP